MKNSLLVILCLLLFACTKTQNAKVEKPNLSEAFLVDSTTQAVNEAVETEINRQIYLSELEPDFSKIKKDLSSDDYQNLLKISDKLKKRGLNICEFYYEIEKIATDAREFSSSIYPKNMVKEMEQNSDSLQKVNKDAYLKKLWIKDTDAIFVTLIFTKYGKNSICN